MPEKELPYGIIAVIVLFIVVIGLSQLFIKETKGLSKENFECKYLSLLPGFCTEEDKQKILEEDKQAQTNEINQFIDKIILTFKTCGENSQKQICKCSLEPSKFIDSMITITKKTNNKIYIKSYNSNYEKIIDTLTELYINNNKNKIVSLNSIYGTKSIFFNTEKEILEIKTSNNIIIELKSKEDINKIAIFKQGDKKGIYFPYINLDQNHINIPDC